MAGRITSSAMSLSFSRRMFCTTLTSSIDTYSEIGTMLLNKIKYVTMCSTMYMFPTNALKGVSRYLQDITRRLRPSGR